LLFGVSAKSKKEHFFAPFAPRATLSNVERERAVSLCLDINDLISMTGMTTFCDFIISENIEKGGNNG